MALCSLYWPVDWPAFCVLWYGLYRPVVYRFLGIQHSLNLNSFSTLLKFSAGTVIAIVLGTATHIIRDGLTHVDFRTFAFREFLSQPVTLFNVTYPMHRVLQIGTSFVALPFLLWMCVHYYKTYRQYRPVQSRKLNIMPAGWSYWVSVQAVFRYGIMHSIFHLNCGVLICISLQENPLTNLLRQLCLSSALAAHCFCSWIKMATWTELQQ